MLLLEVVFECGSNLGESFGFWLCWKRERENAGSGTSVYREFCWVWWDLCLPELYFSSRCDQLKQWWRSWTPVEGGVRGVVCVCHAYGADARWLVQLTCIRVTGPDGRNVHNTNTIDGEQFEFIAHHKGRYKFCFHNPLSAPEQVTFYIHVGHVPGVEDLAKDEHLKPVDVKIAQLGELLEAVSAEIRYLQTRDLRHRRKPAYSCDYSNCLLTSLPHFFDHNPQADLLILLGVVVAKPDEGKIANESIRKSSSQFQRVSAMRDIKNVATENLESFTELPNLQILEVLGATQPSKYIEPVAEKQSSNSSA